MPHFILEHSSNLDAETLAVDDLFAKLHQAAVDTTWYPLAGIRSRAHSCKHFRVADGEPSHSFVHLSVKIGGGRSDEQKQQSAERFFTVLKEHLAHIYSTQALAASFEMTELPPVLKYNYNNVRDYL